MQQRVKTNARLLTQNKRDLLRIVTLCRKNEAQPYILRYVEEKVKVVHGIQRTLDRLKRHLTPGLELSYLCRCIRPLRKAGGKKYFS